LPVETGVAHPRSPSKVDVSFRRDQVLLDHASLRDASGKQLLDARAAPRYRGDTEPLDRVGGHVPGALNRPFAENLAEDGRFKSPLQLREEFNTVLRGAAPAKVVHMCGSGVSACHNLLAMEHAGLHGSRLYAPSWSGWVSDPSRPVATGEE
jgi:thiosulfate/3-mercaptopyruvate sulfurtransferase